MLLPRLASGASSIILSKTLRAFSAPHLFFCFCFFRLGTLPQDARSTDTGVKPACVGIVVVGVLVMVELTDTTLVNVEMEEIIDEMVNVVVTVVIPDVKASVGAVKRTVLVDTDVVVSVLMAGVTVTTGVMIPRANPLPVAVLTVTEVGTLVMLTGPFS